jgi:hypothetical protein
MDTKNLIINYSSNWKIVENIREVLPHLRITILALTFSVKSVNLCNLSGFMISSDKTNPTGIAEF